MAHNKFQALKAAAATLGNDAKSVGLFIEVCTVLRSANERANNTIDNGKLEPMTNFDDLIDLYVMMILGCDVSLSESCIEWFAGQGLDIDDGGF